MNAPAKRSDLLAAATTADPRWARVQARDKGADGTFVLGVRTTGVYCRPSCAARQPRPENVTFFAAPADAQRAGFRACKRCRPDHAASAQATLIARACRTIEGAEEPPMLDTLAAQAGLSPFHFHRLFKDATGVTPRAYAAQHRTKRVQEGLTAGRPVTEAIFDAGFNSGSRFYEGSDATLGMKPTAFRSGGTNELIRFAVGQCSLGAVLVAATEKGVCAITLGDDAEVLLHDLQGRFVGATLVGGDRDFEALVARVVGLVEAPDKGLDLPLDVRGTAFQRRVWEALRAVPPGETASYAEVAARIGAPAAVRAVASACAKNALAIAIPCHRVVRTGGDPANGGYRWGIERKRALLEREKCR